ncbi:MAG TPA: CHAT domain-containing tetratricopeptide repeat protein [Stenomitos sp.]
MRLQRIGLIALLALLATLTIDNVQLIQNPKSKILNSQVLAQTPDGRKTEADRLLQQGYDESISRELRLKSMQQALEIYRQIKDRKGELSALISLANAYNTLSDYQKAIDYQQQILAIAHELKDRFFEESALKSLGEIYHTLGDYRKMIDYEQKLLAIAREPKQDDVCKFCEPKKDVESERFALEKLEYAYRALGDSPNAISYQRQRLALGQETSNSDNAVSVADSPVGNNVVGETRKAEADRLLQQWTPAKQYELLAKLGTQLAEQLQTNPQKQNAALRQDAQVRRTAFETGIATLQRSLEIYRQIKDRKGEEDALASLGQAYYLLATFGNQTSFDSPFSLQANSSSSIMNSLFSSIQEKLSKASEYQEQRLAIARELKNPEDVEQSLQALSGTYRTFSQFSDYLGDYSKIIDSLQKSLAIERELKYRIPEGEVLGSLGEVYYRLREYNKAIDYQQQSLVIVREQNHPPGVESALSGLGRAYSALGEYNKAIDYHQQSLAIARELKITQYIGCSLSDLGVALEGAGRLSEAEHNLLEAIVIWENLRDDINQPAVFQGNEAHTKVERNLSKIQQLEAQSTTYRSLQRVLIAQNKVDAALEIAERGRARAFIELLASRIPKTGTVSPVIPSISVTQIKEVAKAQNATLVEYSIVDDIKDAGFDSYGAESVVEQKVHESALYVWVVQSTGAITFRKVDLKPLWQKQNTSLAELVTSSRDSIGVRGRGLEVVARVDVANPTAVLQQLYQLLIEPIADLLPTDPSDRVVFFPQESLFLVPFPALQGKDGKYLIEKHTLLTAPSIQVLELTRKQSEQVGARMPKPLQPQDALVVGNPIMPSVPPAPGEKPQPLAPLPGAQEEALAIAPMLNTKPLIGNLATKSAVVQLLPKARIIHLATHGLLDDERGIGSAIALAPDSSYKEEIGKVNGLLTAEEILDMKLNAELVVLSACNTGRGRITGDGVIGLSRSLISAGVPSVLVSLWSVPDAPTASLMSEFYQNWQKNPDKAQALRQAMLTTMKQHPNPKNWAAFTLIGESD